VTSVLHKFLPVSQQDTSTEYEYDDVGNIPP